MEELRSRVDELIGQGRALRRVDYDRMRAVADEAFELACQDGPDGPVYPHGMAAALGLLAHRNVIIGEWSATISEAAQALALIESEEPDLVRAEMIAACELDPPLVVDVGIGPNWMEAK